MLTWLWSSCLPFHCYSESIFEHLGTAKEHAVQSYEEGKLGRKLVSKKGLAWLCLQGDQWNNALYLNASSKKKRIILIIAFSSFHGNPLVIIVQEKEQK